MFSDLVKPIYRQQWISEAAYFIAETRGFEPGRELDDWLRAEVVYLKMLIRVYLSILDEDHIPVTLYELSQLATAMDIQHADTFTSTVELIRAIQIATKQLPCFRAEPHGHCEEMECEWRKECRKLISVSYR